MSPKSFANGIHVPLITPFNEDESINYDALGKQVVRLVKAGVGIVLLGTNGEASHLSSAERVKVVQVARKALVDAGLGDEPLLVGTGGGSAATTIEIAKEAKAAGATHSIVICPGYFAFAMARDRAAVLGFFKKVMDSSPLPVMIYNFPGAASGIDLTSDELIELAEHPNCFGAKLTCAMIGKGQRLANHVKSSEFLAKHEQRLQSVSISGEFQVLPGFSESLLPALLGGHTGCITGTGNVFPKTIQKLYKASIAGLAGDAKALQEAMELQKRITRSDWIIVKVGIQGTKYALDTFVEKGLGGTVRSPLGPITDATKKIVDEQLKEDWEFESKL
ncbi:4-hydroxy-2-oxoglutarate aldolase, partial [Tremellales sp. Uapishka_1]